jgi:hypothetical protein
LFHFFIEIWKELVEWEDLEIAELFLKSIN